MFLALEIRVIRGRFTQGAMGAQEGEISLTRKGKL